MEANFRVSSGCREEPPPGPARWRSRWPPGSATRDRYLTWIEILAEKTEEELAALGPAALAAIRRDLSQAPSLFDLAHGRIGSIEMLKAFREESSQAGAPLGPWLDRVVERIRHCAVAGRGNAGDG